MAYLVFARKWRPLAFEDVVGQAHITDTLKRAIEKDRVAHAYIFTGTRGVGKTTTARILARALNCDNGPTTEPCGVCESCKAVINGNSFDVMEIDGASNNGVDQIRELRDNIGYTSMGGKYRIFVIDEVHMLSTGAFNALLKTLEEPPEKVIFIFATTEPHKIPDTIHSRCQRFDFRAISEEHIGAHLEKICGKEGINYDANSISLISHKAAGSMRDSLSLLDQAYSFCGENLQEEEVRSVLGLVSTEVFQKIMDGSLKSESALAISALEETLNRGYDLAEFLTGFQEYLRTLLFLSIPGGTSSLSGDIEPHYREVASHFSEGDLLRMSELVKKCENELRFSSLPRFLVEMMLVKLVNLDSTQSVSQLLSYIKDGVPADVEIPDSLSYEKKKVIETTPAPRVELPKEVVVEKKEDEPLVETLDNKPSNVVEESSAEQEIVLVDENSTEVNSTEYKVEEPIIDDTPSQPLEDTTPVDEPLVKDSIPVRVAVADIKGEWGSFLTHFGNTKKVLVAFLELGRVVEVDDESIDIRFAPSNSFQQHELARHSNRELIEKALEEFTGVKRKLHITVEKEQKLEIPEPPKDDLPPVEESPLGANSVEGDEKHHSLSFEDEINKEPIIKKVIEIFNGEVL